MTTTTTWKFERCKVVFCLCITKYQMRLENEEGKCNQLSKYEPKQWRKKEKEIWKSSKNT